MNFLELFFGRGFWKSLGAVRGERRRRVSKNLWCDGGNIVTLWIFWIFLLVQWGFFKIGGAYCIVVGLLLLHGGVMVGFYYRMGFFFFGLVFCFGFFQ
jgi:hypothetical protein